MADREVRVAFAAALLAALPAIGRAQTLADQIGGCLGNPPEQTIAATPANYRSLIPTLQPGDRLQLAAGTYTQGLPLDDLHGEAGRCIVIEGPETGAPAVFTGRSCCNTVSLTDVSYVAIRNLELDGLGLAVDGVKAESPSTSVHHVTIENLDISGHGASQGIVGISTKCPAWNWVIRRNVIDRAGTGLYLGNSDGSAEFVNGLIEHNLITDSRGYNAQLKHQLTRNVGLGEPANGRTVIRHNVFSKVSNASTGSNARPSLLVGHWPLTGPGASDVYEIYGNLFHQNPVEAMFQGEGNIALYDNLFLRSANPGFPAIAIQPHNDVPRAVDVFHNTVVAAGTGISITGGAPGTTQTVLANAVFAGTPISGGTQEENVTDGFGSADLYLNAPDAPIGSGLDLFPLVGTLTGPDIDSTGLTGFRDWDRDFDGTARDLAFRGAYSGEGSNPGWVVALERKPEPSDPGPPTSPSVTVTRPNGGEKAFSAVPYRVQWSASDDEGLSFFDVFVSYNSGASFDPTPVCDDVPGGNTSCLATFTVGATNSNVRVRVVAYDTSLNTGSDESDASFKVALATPSITMTQPNATGTPWQAGTAKQIKFNHNLTAGAPVRIELDRDYPSGTWETIAASHATTAGSSSTYNWLVTAPATPGATARIRVTSLDMPSVSDVSNNGFRIKSRVTVAKPNTAVSWKVGSTKTITFTHNYTTPHDFSIDIDRNGDLVCEGHIANKTANGGTASFTWTVSGPTGNTNRICVTSLVDPLGTDISDVSFTLTP